jgi:hypothetical protein
MLILPAAAFVGGSLVLFALRTIADDQARVRSVSVPIPPLAD